MDNQLLTLSKIFTERLFRIPDYQRGYAWTEKQLKDFWNDIQQLEENSNHYTGVITLESVSPDIYKLWNDDFWIIQHKSYQPYFVVDGQQRLTTAIVLIQAILEQIKSEGKLNFTSCDDIRRRFIFDSKDDGISRSYVFGYEKDNPSYEFLKTKIFCEYSSASTTEETIYTQNLAYAKQFFAGKLEVLPHAEIEILFRKVTQQLLFNIFTITEDVDVCVAFETMNNRGKRLSYLELLKNRLIYLSLKLDDEEYERKKLRIEINDCWKSIYHNLGRNKKQQLDDDLFLKIHYVIYFGKDLLKDEGSSEHLYFRKFYRMDYASDLLENRFISRNATSDALKKTKVTLNSIHEYVRSLQKTVQTWYKMWNPFDSDFTDEVKVWLDKISHFSVLQYHPLILVFLQSVNSEPSRVAFLKAIERDLFVRSLFNGRYGGERYYEIHPEILQWALDLRAGKTIAEKVTKQLSERTADLLKRNPVISRFRSDGFYQWDGVRYFLFEYEMDLQKRAKSPRAKILWAEFNEQKNDYVSVEHIYPRQARNEYWTSRFGKLKQNQKEALRDSIGNLLPLSKPKNSSLSNKPFPEKVDGNKEAVVGYRYGGYAENEVAKEEEWTPQSILQRGIKLLEFMERRWEIQIGDEIKKRTMLGLDFMD